MILDRTISRAHGWMLLLLVVATVALAVDDRPSGQREAYTSSRVTADSLYRAKRFDDAAATLQHTALSGALDRELASELVMIASFYGELGRSYALAMDPQTPLQEAIAALRWAIELDAMLGGAHAGELERAPVDP